MKAEDNVRIEYVPLSKLQRWPRNPKLHDRDELGRSIERWGFVQPLTIDERSGKLVAGHGRLEALLARKEAGLPPPSRIKVTKDDWNVPVIRGVSFASEQEAEAYLVADNRMVEIGGWDDKALSVILEDLRKQNVDFAGIGWDPAELDRMVADVTQSDAQGTTPGDLASGFLEGAIKQLVLYFPGPEFDSIVARMQKVMEQTGVDSHTAAFLKMLEHYEATAHPASGG